MYQREDYLDILENNQRKAIVPAFRDITLEGRKRQLK